MKMNTKGRVETESSQCTNKRLVISKCSWWLFYKILKFLFLTKHLWLKNGSDGLSTLPYFGRFCICLDRFSWFHFIYPLVYIISLSDTWWVFMFELDKFSQVNERLKYTHTIWTTCVRKLTHRVQMWTPKPSMGHGIVHDQGVRRRETVNPSEV